MKKEIRSHYIVNGENEVTFRIGSYDRRLPLIINPVLAYSTYLGGSTIDAAYDIAVDSAGNAYVTGVTTSTDFPTGVSIGSPPRKFKHKAADGKDAGADRVDPGAYCRMLVHHFLGSLPVK